VGEGSKHSTFGLRWIRRRLTRLFYERGRLEDTYGTVDLSELGLGHPERIEYEPSSWTALPRALEGIEIRSDDVFLDYGCGKGRVIYQAAMLPFRRVTGLELSDELLSVARRNIERNRGRLKCADVELIHGDVTEFEVPDDVTIAYLYNPFTGDLFRSAIDGLVRSLERRPRRLTIVYVNPTMADDLERVPAFQLIRTLPGEGGHAIKLYRTRPDPAA